jgi:parvulin-like peptidyl-prolyl isomerase
MAPNLKLYTVLSYILIPISLFFAFLDIALLLSSLVNPSALIMVFILACLVIYTFASFKFLKAGIEKEVAQTAKLKDWIKVNAYVSFFLCSLFFINAISILISSDVLLLKFIDEFILVLNFDVNLMISIFSYIIIEDIASNSNNLAVLLKT